MFTVGRSGKLKITYVTGKFCSGGYKNNFLFFLQSMKESISKIENARQVLDQPSPWDDQTRVSVDFLPPLFRSFYQKTGMSGRVAKSDFHFLVEHMEPQEIDHEVVAVLDSIVNVSYQANQLRNRITE